MSGIKQIKKQMRNPVWISLLGTAAFWGTLALLAYLLKEWVVQWAATIP